jgi:hypothetical protein
MACTRHNNYQNPNGTQPITNRAILRRASQNCRRNNTSYPSFAPLIYNLSVLSSCSGLYSLVYIDGANFLPAAYGTTYVNFGQFTELPITFYSSFNISFVVPLNAPPGNYAVTVVNVYNGNFSPAINETYPGNLVYSNSITYTLIDCTPPPPPPPPPPPSPPPGCVSYSLTGTYSITSDSRYNTIITFTNNGTFTILNQCQSVQINCIVVGGGGGGGGGNIGGEPGAGGGGGGGVSSGFFNSSVTTYVMTVGAGGQGGTLGTSMILATNGVNGSPSQISGVVTVNGGSYGLSSTNNGAGGNGGNGGAGGTGNTSPGGDGASPGGGGGGGIYSAFGDGTGGDGALSISVYSYGTSFGAGGGGGGGDATNGTAGNIYAGNGGGINATANYGGGGGGGKSGNGIPTTDTNGGNGGSGRIVLYFNN